MEVNTKLINELIRKVNQEMEEVQDEIKELKKEFLKEKDELKKEEIKKRISRKDMKILGLDRGKEIIINELKKKMEE